MDQNWFYRGNALIHSLSEQETTSHSVAVWRIGQCGVFLKYNGKIILIDPVLEPIYGTDGFCRTHFEPPFSADANFSVDAVFCTHNHLDHFQPDTICKLAASHPNVKFFVPTGILDEIQETPNALKALKYFYENANEYHIVAAGSLLGVAMHQGTSFPVGKVNFMDLMPLSFFEFLNALGQEHLLNLLKNNEFDMISVFNNKYKDYLKLYYYIGGMPEVVNSYVEEKDLAEVRNIQKTLLKDYEQDFSKHAPNNIVPRIRQLWNNIPTQLAKENKKFIYGLVKEGARAREYEIALSWLIDCGLIYQVNRVNNCKVPLSAYQDFNAFKLYLLDVGLLAAMSDLDSKTILEGNDIFEEFKGSLTEQYVLCQLKECTELNVFYWSSEKGIAEIDFIVQIGKNNVPIEVKSNENLQAKSLKSFVEKYNTKINVRTSMANFREEEWLTNIPLYSIGNIEKTIK